MNADLARLRMVAGVVIWALHFAAIYAFTGVACARHVPGPVPLAIALATLVGAGACALIVIAELRQRQGFESWMTGGLAAVALLAIVWEAVPVLVVTPCE